MRLSRIDMNTSDLAEPLSFSLVQEDRGSKYQIQSILGLDAAEIVPKFYGRGTDSNRFYDMGLRARDIAMSLFLNPDWANEETNSDLRDDLYRAISASRSGFVDLTFYDGAKVVSGISGFISKFEVDHMARKPSVQLTITCDDPIFRSVTPVRWLYGTTEHPGVSPILIPDTVSTAPHGFSFSLTCHTVTPKLTITDQLFFPNWEFEITPAGGFVVGDVLHFSSEFSNRYLYKVNGATTTHLIDKVSPESVWPIIFPGQNSFFFDNLDKFDWTGYLEYKSAFWGV